MVITTSQIGHGGTNQDLLNQEDRIEYKDDHKNQRTEQFSEGRFVKKVNNIKGGTSSAEKVGGSGLMFKSTRNGRTKKSNSMMVVNKTSGGVRRAN